MAWGRFLPQLAGGIGGAIGQAFSPWENPYEAGYPDVAGAEGRMAPYFKPWIEAGERQIPGMEEEYGRLRSDPGGFINNMGKGYQQSPGFEFAMKRALGAMGNKAAAGGMTGTPQSAEWNADIASNMASRDYNTWLQNALGAYGKGLQGGENFMNRGAEMGKDFGNSVGNLAMQQALWKYLQQESENQRWGNMFGNIGAGLGIGGSMFGGMR